MTVTPETLGTWRGWIGRTETRREVADPGAVRRYAAALGCDLDVERAPPPLAHLALFLPAPGAHELGVDGHPSRGGFLPPVDLPRRMWAAGSFRFHAPVVLGREAERASTVAEVVHREGKSGELVFVEIDHRISQDGALCVAERQTLVYRHAGGRVDTVVATEGPDAEEELWIPGAVELFRFSAATFNGHRIHYDQPYARQAEGYPDLVVHGPLTAARLCHFAAWQAGRPLASFAFRALAPLFVDQPVRLRPGEGEGEVEAVRCDGVAAMRATAGF